MEIKIKIDENIKEPYITIYTSEITEEIKNINRILNNKDNILTGNYNEKIIILEKKEIEIIRVEDSKVFIYIKDKKCYTNKRLYEVEAILDRNFIRISKSTIVNIKRVNYVEPSFNGSMCIVMNNKIKDYISRKYLPDFKKRLGL